MFNKVFDELCRFGNFSDSFAPDVICVDGSKRISALLSYFRRRITRKQYDRLEENLNLYSAELVEAAFRLGFARGMAFLVDSLKE